MTRYHPRSPGPALARLALAVLLAGGGVALPTSAPRSLAAAPAVAIPVQAAPFTDIGGHWAKPEVEALWARGALEAGSGLFRPDDRVTRGEFVAVLVRALGYGGEAADLWSVPPPFGDVTSQGDLAGFINVATEYGLVRGYPDGTFQATRLITRDEMSALLVRVLGLEATVPGPGGLPFIDRAVVPEWAAGYVATAFERGLVRGYPDGSFRPREGATRAEAICLVCRTIRLDGRLYDVTGIVRAASADGSALAVDLWPAGTPEAASAPDGSVNFTPPDSLAPSGPGPTVCLRVPPGAVIYRDGNLTGPGDLRPLDEIAVLLDGGARVAFAETTRLDGLARVVSVGPALATVSLLPVTVAGRGEAGGATVQPTARQFAVAPWAPVFSDGGEVTGTARPGAVKPGDEIYFVLDTASGAIRALAVVGPDVGPAGSAGPAGVGDPAVSSESVLSPAQAMALNASAVAADKLRTLVEADGRGVTIAVIDTGVDVTHPDLAMTSTLERKVVDWVDLTGEGDVSTTRISTASKGVLSTGLGPATTGTLVSKSGFFHSGVLSEQQLDPGSPLAQDIDRNGSTVDSFLVVTVDSRTSGVYDTAYVDSDRDLDLTDEVALRPYRETGLVGWFGDHARSRAERCPFVLADLRGDGNRVTLGFDGNGHGTHVAAIAAAYGSFRGGADGIAPGSKILAVKALGSSGDGSWSDITRGVTYAALHGANVVTLSLANLSGGDGLEEETAQLAAAARKYGVLLVVAAGNDGPGLGTARGLGDSPGVLTVGASVTGPMWKAYYGYEVKEDTLWPFSAVGPRPDGSSGPDLVAPGCAVSAAPLWLESPGYAQLEGTSMAVPHVAGTAALVWQAARDGGRAATAVAVSAALLAGADPLPGYGLVEAGRGQVNALAAWAWLNRPSAAEDYVAVPVEPRGLVFRDGAPARLMVRAKGNLLGPAGFAGPVWVDLAPDAPWLDPEKARLALPAGVERRIGMAVELAEPVPPSGLYSGRLVGRKGEAEVLSVPITFVVSDSFGPDGHWRVAGQGTLGPGRLARHFFRVPPGARGIEVSCGVTASEGERDFDGRVKVYLYAPDGSLAGSTAYVGEGTEDLSGYAVVEVDEPAGGVWEAVVYSSAALSAFDLETSEYWLEAGLDGLVFGLPSEGWDVSVPRRPALADASVSQLRPTLGRAWRPLAGLDDWGRKVEVWGSEWPELGQDVAPGPERPVQLGGTLPWTNVEPGFRGGVQGYGLWSEAWSGETGRASLRPGEAWSVSLPYLEGGSGLLRVVLRPIGQDGVGPAERPRLDLVLYRREGGGWVECVRSVVDGVSAEVMELVDPAAGDYVVYVEAREGGTGQLAFECRIWWLASAGQVVSPTTAVDFGPGASGGLPVGVDVPVGEGTYQGALRVDDTHGSLGLHGGDGATASLLPVTVRRSGEPVILLCLPGWVTPGRNLLTFQARSQTGRLLEDFALELDGRLYQASGGRLTVPYTLPAGWSTSPPEGEAARVARLAATLVPSSGPRTTWSFFLPLLSPGPAGLSDEGFRPPELSGVRDALAASLWGG